MTLAFDTPSTNDTHGYLLDGKSPRRQVLSLSVAADRLTYRLHTGGSGLWTFAAIDWAQSPLDRRPLYLKSLEQEDAWLVLNDAKILQEMQTAYQAWATNNFWLIHAEKRNVLLSFLFVLSLFVGLWLAWPSIADWISAVASPSLRASIEYLGDNALKNERICSTPEADRALAMLQNRLAQGRPQLQQLKLVVIDSKAVNAFAMLGNRVVLTRGLISEAQSSDEIAGVLAHEFGHILNDHVIRGFLRNSFPRLVMSTLGRALGVFPSLADQAVSNAHTRDFEKDADATAVVLLHDAHIPPAGLKNFFARLEGEHHTHGILVNYLSDHPAPEDREAMMDAAEKNTGLTTAPLDDTQWIALKEVCELPERPSAK